jgi:hypothetical protein
MALHELKRGTRRYQVNDTATISYTVPFSISGGTLTYYNTKSVVTFTGSATASVFGAVPKNVQILLIGGGGGGCAGGAGAGGLIYNGSYSLSSGSYAVVIGAGGSASYTDGGDLTAIPASGTSSVFRELRATGGGGGGGIWQGAGVHDGFPGGSGGGSGPDHSDSGGYGGVAISSSAQGRDGGFSLSIAQPYAAAGGGGSNELGGNNLNNTVCGNGGSGSYNNINGSGSYWAGGGAGACYSATGAVDGKSHIAAGGGAALGGTGSANTGGGGGGNRSNARGGNGGSGILIIAYDT